MRARRRAHLVDQVGHGHALHLAHPVTHGAAGFVHQRGAGLGLAPALADQVLDWSGPEVVPRMGPLRLPLAEFAHALIEIERLDGLDGLRRPFAVAWPPARHRDEALDDGPQGGMARPVRRCRSAGGGFGSHARPVQIGAWWFSGYIGGKREG